MFNLLHSITASCALALASTALQAHDLKFVDDRISGKEIIAANQTGFAQLQEAAERMGVGGGLEPRSYSEVVAGEMIFAAASASEFTNVPATKIYQNPAVVGMVYYHSVVSGLRPGFYAMQVSSLEPVEKVGDHPALMELVSMDGEVVADRKVTLDVFSLEPTSINGWQGTVITPTVRFEESMAGGFAEAFAEAAFWCSNGMHIEELEFLTPRF